MFLFYILVSFMLGFPCCFLYAMESLLVLRKGEVMWPSPPPLSAAAGRSVLFWPILPLIRCADRRNEMHLDTVAYLPSTSKMVMYKCHIAFVLEVNSRHRRSRSTGK